jgi:hypothetical protein
MKHKEAMLYWLGASVITEDQTNEIPSEIPEERRIRDKGTEY